MSKYTYFILNGGITMKKTTTFLSVAALVVALTACSDNSNQEEANGNVPENENESVNDYGNNNENNQSNSTDGEQGTEEATNEDDAEVNDSENESSDTNENGDGEEEKVVLTIGNSELVVPLSFELDDDVLNEVKERDVDKIDYLHPHAHGNAVTELDRFKEEHELQLQLIKSAYQDEFYSEETLELFHDWEEDVSTNLQRKFVDEDSEWVVDEYWIASGHIAVEKSDDSDEELEALMLNIQGNEYNKKSGKTRGFTHGYRFDGELRRMNLTQILHEDEREVSDRDFHQ